MEALIPIVAILMVFGPPFYWIKRRYDLKEKTLEGRTDAEAQHRIAGLEQERKLLQERVENLESIVTGVDYELNMRIARLAAAQSQHGAAPAGLAEEPAPSERTLTAARPSARSLAAKAEALREAIAPALEAGRVINNRYRIDRLLGRGGMGAVYLADDEVLGEPVALKVIASELSADRAGLVDRFRREASAARKISHPNVIRIHDLGEAPGGLLFISMEYLAGKTLAERVEARGALDPRAARELLGQVCDGLGAAHDAGVVHRDLKPQNVLIGERELVKLIDFGLAKTAVMASMTATGIMLGTPYYMSPEQVRGKEVDARSDLYSLGALVYHAVTGVPPFTGDNPIAIGFAHCSEKPRPPRELAPQISAELDAMILRALEKDPRDRPHSALQFRAAL